MVIVARLTIANERAGNDLKGVVEWMDQEGVANTQNGIVFTYIKKEILAFEATWMNVDENVKGVMLSE